MLSDRIRNLAHSVGMTVDLASNRIALEPKLYKNKQYHPDGVLVLSMKSLDIWSFRTAYDAMSFLRMLQAGSECYPNVTTLSFYSETSATLDCYHVIRKIKHGYSYIGEAYSSHFNACYLNRLGNGDLYCKELHRKQLARDCD